MAKLQRIRGYLAVSRFNLSSYQAEFGIEARALTHFLLLICITKPSIQACLPSDTLENLGFKGGIDDEDTDYLLCGDLSPCIPFEVVELKAWFDSQKLMDRAQIKNNLLMKLDQFWDSYNSQESSMFKRTQDEELF